MCDVDGVAGSFSFRYQPVLGTELHVVVGCASRDVAEGAQQRVLEEILRLDALLSSYRPDSPWSRWMRSDSEELPNEAVAVLALAQDWFVRSEGAFNPGLGGLKSRWREAEREVRLPTRDECRQLAAVADRLPYAVSAATAGQRVVRTGDCTTLDLDALAKGWVVDRAAEVEQDAAVAWVMVNVGGDLRLTGPGSVRVAIEHPASTIDNALPLGVVTMGPGGMASSGPARRGFRVGGRWYGHVLDPRTGWPVEGGAGVTVIAADTVSADVLATVVGVRNLGDPMTDALLDSARAAALEVSAAGALQPSPRWHTDVAFERTAPRPATG